MGMGPGAEGAEEEQGCDAKNLRLYRILAIGRANGLSDERT